MSSYCANGLKKMSTVLLPSPPTRSVANDSKATALPSAVIAGSRLNESESPPALSTLARVVVAPTRSDA